MLNELYQHRLHYLLLFAGLFLGLAFFFGIFGLPQLRIEAVIGLCSFYFFWGLAHHLAIGDLHIKIVVEYFLIASIAGAVLLSLIFRMHPA